MYFISRSRSRCRSDSTEVESYQNRAGRPRIVVVLRHWTDDDKVLVLIIPFSDFVALKRVMSPPVFAVSVTVTGVLTS